MSQNGCWTIVVGVSSRDVTATVIRDRLDSIEGVETLAISSDKDDAARLLGVEPGTLVIDVRGGPDA